MHLHRRTGPEARHQSRFAPDTRIREQEVLLGAFSHSAGTAPIITVIIQVTTLKTTHLRNHAQSI